MPSVLSGAPLSALKVNSRPTIRGAVNQYDKSTIFSIYPQEIVETKITLIPWEFRIPAGQPAEPGLLVVGPASWWRDIEPDQPLLEIPVSSVVIAESIVKDYCNSRIESNMSTAVPGLFYLPGELTVKDLMEKHSKILQDAIVKQRNWYQSLVKLADSLWAQTNGNPRVIPEEAKIAARELSLSRDWVTNFSRLEMVPCAACGTLRNPNFPICGNCKAVVDKEKAEKLGLVFAK